MQCENNVTCCEKQTLNLDERINILLETGQFRYFVSLFLNLVLFCTVFKIYSLAFAYQSLIQSVLAVS